jgi:stage III sporulation protein AD
MLTAMRLVGFGLVVVVLLVVLGQFQHRPIALVVRLGAVAVLLLAILGPLDQVLVALNRLVALSHVRGLYLTVLLKVVGIAYLATLGAQLAQDAGEQAVATKIELAGKVLILVLAVPVVTAIVRLLLQLLPS